MDASLARGGGPPWVWDERLEQTPRHPWAPRIQAYRNARNAARATLNRVPDEDDDT